jgi:hypothetical protein
MRKLATALLFFAASVAPTFGQTLVGQPIHDFTLPDLNGTFRSPSQYKGKILGIFLLGHD